jgi:hypothetical protein
LLLLTQCSINAINSGQRRVCLMPMIGRLDSIRSVVAVLWSALMAEPPYPFPLTDSDQTHSRRNGAIPYAGPEQTT